MYIPSNTSKKILGLLSLRLAQLDSANKTDWDQGHCTNAEQEPTTYYASWEGKEGSRENDADTFFRRPSFPPFFPVVLFQEKEDFPLRTPLGFPPVVFRRSTRHERRSWSYEDHRVRRVNRSIEDLRQDESLRSMSWRKASIVSRTRRDSSA